MGLSTYNDTGYKEFQEATQGSVGTDLLVELDANAKIIPLATPGNEIGTAFNRAFDAKGDSINVAMINKAGTMRMIAGGPITPGQLVEPQAGGKVVAKNLGDPVARFLGDFTTQDGDVIEVMATTSHLHTQP